MAKQVMSNEGPAVMYLDGKPIPVASWEIELDNGPAHHLTGAREATLNVTTSNEPVSTGMLAEAMKRRPDNWWQWKPGKLLRHALGSLVRLIWVSAQTCEVETQNGQRVVCSARDFHEAEPDDAWDEAGKEWWRMREKSATVASIERVDVQQLADVIRETGVVPEQWRDVVADGIEGGAWRIGYQYHVKEARIKIADRLEIADAVGHTERITIDSHEPLMLTAIRVEKDWSGDGLWRVSVDQIMAGNPPRGRRPLLRMPHPSTLPARVEYVDDDPPTNVNDPPCDVVD